MDFYLNKSITFASKVKIIERIIILSIEKWISDHTINPNRFKTSHSNSKVTLTITFSNWNHIEAYTGAYSKRYDQCSTSGSFELPR